MNGKIILSEGSNDLKFLSKIAEDYKTDICIDALNLEQATRNTQRPREAEMIRNFNESFNPYELLIKAEGGKPNLKRIFSSLIKSLTQFNCEVFMMMDLDGSTLDNEISDINDHLNGIYTGNNVSIETDSTISSTSVLITKQYRILVNDSHSGDFGLIAFENCLETVADINDSDDSDTIESKIEELIHEPRVRDPVIETVF